MALGENITGTIRNCFDVGLDEVLVFAVVFIFILLSGNESGGFDENCDNIGILPLLIIGAFILIFTGVCRTEESAG